MAYRLAKRAEADLDDIADYIAAESGSLDTAARVIEALTGPVSVPCRQSLCRAGAG